MNLSGLLDDYPEIEEEIGSLSQEDSTRFQRLFAKRCQKLSLPLIIVACLGIYCFVVGLWLHPSYSWVFALLPTLFLTVFGRSQIAGIISTKNQASKYYGLISLPLVFAALCTLCGALSNAYFNISFNNSSYSVESLQQQKEDCESRLETDKYRCDNVDSDLRDAERQRDEDKPELLRGIIMSAVAIIAIYPVSVYYLRSVIRKNNLLTIKQILAQLKERGSKPPPPSPPSPPTDPNIVQ